MKMYLCKENLDASLRVDVGTLKVPPKCFQWKIIQEEEEKVPWIGFPKQAQILARVTQIAIQYLDQLGS